MNQRVLRALCLFAIVVASIISRTPVADAAASNFVPKSSCRLNTSFLGWGGSAVLHANGLIYVTRTFSTFTSFNTFARLSIVAIDPDAATSGSCPIVAVYNDDNTYSSLSALRTPAVGAADASGNVYIGRGSKSPGGASCIFRMLVIPNTTTKDSPFNGILKRNIVSSINADYVLGSAIAVSATHVAVGIAPWYAGTVINGAFGAVPIAAILGNQTDISTTFYLMGSEIYDSIVALPNGNFLVMGSVKASPISVQLFDPVNATIKNPFTGNNGSGNLECGPDTWMCATPSASLGEDGNVYIVITRLGNSCLNCTTYIWKLDTTSMKFKGLGTDASATLVPTFVGYYQSYGGASILADASGSVAVGILHNNTIWSGKPLTPPGGGTISVYSDGTWTSQDISRSPSDASYGLYGHGRPNMLIGTVQGEERLFVFSTLWGGSDVTLPGVYMHTFTSALAGSSSRCKANMSIENGALFINTNVASGALYTKSSCTATKYYAVADNKATPPASIDQTKINAFSPANGTIKIDNLVEGTNYLHVQLLDNANKNVDSWINSSIIVDTASKVGATTTIANASTGPYYLDSYSMRGSSYTAEGFTRSNIGVLKVTGVTDPTGLDKYTVDDSNQVTFMPSMVNQSIPVSLNAITSTVGISLTLTDGAGNSETRGLRSLIVDTDPPVVSSNPNITFSPGTGLFTGTLSLSGGSVTDTIYNAQTGKNYWGLWVANAVQNGGICPADTAPELRWGAVPVDSASPSIGWNVLNGLKTPAASGTYCTYIRFLDGAGNASTTAISTTTTISMTASKIYTPIVFGQR